MNLLAEDTLLVDSSTNGSSPRQEETIHKKMTIIPIFSVKNIKAVKYCWRSEACRKGGMLRSKDISRNGKLILDEGRLLTVSCSCC